MESTSVQNIESNKSQTSDEHFVLKPFVQTPDAEIAMSRDIPGSLRWHDRWDRRCGNPAVSIITKSH